MPDTEYGKTTLELIQALIARGIENISVLMRHSARHYDWEHPENEPFMSLTDQGKEYAFNLGKSLPQGLTVRPFSSIFGRCIETAYLIDKGYVSTDGRTVHNQIEASLSPFYVKKPYELANVLKSKRPDFVRYWFEGNIPEEVIDPPHRAAYEIVQMLSQKLTDQPLKQINMGITHDWNLYLVKEYIMGLKHEEVGKVEYLEGIVVYREQGKTVIASHQSDPIVLEQ